MLFPPVRQPTLHARTACRQHKGNHTFLGFIDFDEFVVFLDPTVTSAEQLLRPYEGYGGVSFHWVLAGPNNHTSRPAAGVLDR